MKVVSSRAEKRESDGNVELVPYKTSDGLRDFSGLCDPVRSALAQEPDKSAILFFGYNPRLMNTLLDVKGGAGLFSVIYDTHKGAAEGKSFLKRAAIDLFFKPGLRLVNRLDGVVLFRESAANALKLKVPYCVILPAADLSGIAPYRETGNEKLRFVYAGTLCGYNATKQLADAFASYEGGDAELHVFGDGPLSGYVRDKAQQCDNVEYHGRVTAGELDEFTADSDILINMRDMTSDVNKYAFPSKLVDYMKSGKAVMSTPVSDDPAFEKAVFLCPDTETESILKTVAGICAGRDLIPEKVRGSVDYLKKRHDAKAIYDKLYGFMFAAQ